MLKRAIAFLLMLSYSLYAAETIRVTESGTLFGTGQNLIIDPNKTVYLSGEFGTVENYGSIIIEGPATIGDTYNEGRVFVVTDGNLVINGNYTGLYSIASGGKHLEVGRNTYFPNATVTINGNFTSNVDSASTSIVGIGDGSSLTVTGDFTIDGNELSTYIGDSDSANLTVKGNITIGASVSSLGFNCPLHLSSTSLQTVTLGQSTFFSDLYIENTSTEGVDFIGQLGNGRISNLYANDTNISFSEPLKLQGGGTNIYGNNLNINSSIIQLQGSYSSIEGNVTVNGDVNNTGGITIPSDSSLIINGNYTDSGTDTWHGTLRTSSTITINGNFTSNTSSGCILDKLDYTALATIKVAGDFTVNGSTYGYAERLEVKGDYTINGSFSLPNSDGILYLTGTDQQTVSSSSFNNLTIMNSSPGGIVFTTLGDIIVNGDFSYGACSQITGLDNIYVVGDTTVIGECTSPLSPAVIMYLLN